MNNLVNDPAYKHLQEELHKMLLSWMEKTNDSWKNNWTYPFADNFELTKAPFYSIDEFFEWKKQQHQ